LSKFSDIWTINKTHNNVLAHELKMRFNLLNFARKLFLMLLKKTPTPPPPPPPPPPVLWKLYLCENVLFMLHYKYPSNIYIYQKFVKLRAVSTTFFLIHPVYIGLVSQFRSRVQFPPWMHTQSNVTNIIFT
jgi:hypothetical protein